MPAAAGVPRLPPASAPVHPFPHACPQVHAGFLKAYSCEGLQLIKDKLAEVMAGFTPGAPVQIYTTGACAGWLGWALLLLGCSGNTGFLLCASV